MSFFVVQSSHSNLPRLNTDSRCHDDLEILNEEEIDLHEQQVESPINNNNNNNNHHHIINNNNTDDHLVNNKNGSSSTPKLSVIETKEPNNNNTTNNNNNNKFCWFSRSAVIHSSINNPQLNHVIDHNCTLPQSPSDSSSHHDHHSKNHHSKNSSRSNSRRISADPSSLFNLMRMIKGQKFTIYTPITDKNNKNLTTGFESREVFVFYDAHKSRLGSIYWSFLQKESKTPSSNKDDEEIAEVDFGFIRQKLSAQSIPLHTVVYVNAGKTESQHQSLVTSLPSTNFFTIVTDKITLHLSHQSKIIIDQWILCLKDIFTQHDIQCKDVINDSNQQNNENNKNNKLDGLTNIPNKPFSSTPLFSAFIDPADEQLTDPSILSLSGQRGSVSENSQQSVSAKLSDSLTKTKKTQPDPVAMCGQCIIS